MSTKNSTVYFPGLSSVPATDRSTIQSTTQYVQTLIDQLSEESAHPLQILEAGCGSTCQFRLPTNCHATGIDIAQEQLEKNKTLEVKIQGDIETFPLKPSFYDIIFCWDVLEHLEHPEKALMNFARALRKGGIMVLAAPVVESLKGTITKYSPHTIHVWYYRWRGSPNAGKPGCHPFPTFLKTAMSPNSIVKFANENGFVPEVNFLYPGQALKNLKDEHKLLNVLYFTVGFFVKLLTFGKITPEISDFVLVLRKTV